MKCWALSSVTTTTNPAMLPSPATIPRYATCYWCEFTVRCVTRCNEISRFSTQKIFLVVQGALTPPPTQLTQPHPPQRAPLLLDRLPDVWEEIQATNNKTTIVVLLLLRRTSEPREIVTTQHTFLAPHFEAKSCQRRCTKSPTILVM